MKKLRNILVIVILSIGSTACTRGYDNCVQGMVDEGYSVVEAKELCNDAEMESRIR